MRDRERDRKIERGIERDREGYSGMNIIEGGIS